MKKVLTIAGSDCSGGAGIQADIKTIAAHGMYAMSAITALTAQNTTGVYGIMDAEPDFVAKQLDCIFTDIVPDAVKIGMVSNSRIIGVIAEKLEKYKAKNIVVDPVMVSTSGGRLLSEEAGEALISRLLPLGAVVTPNLPEAEVLCGLNIRNEKDMEKAAEQIAARLGTAVLVKGGHLAGEAAGELTGALPEKALEETVKLSGRTRAEMSDVLYGRGAVHWYRSPRIDNPNTHGTGCTLSSAIACGLAAGKTLDESIREARAYLTGALAAMLDLGKGPGPMDHMYRIEARAF